MTKIHVLADETIGGIKREYVEVDRKAEVGEKIVIVAKNDCEEGYKNGAIFTVDRDFYPGKDDIETDAARSVDNIHGFILREEYHVLEPTDIVHIGTQRYELTERKAEVGEKVIVVDDNDSSEEFGSFRIGEVGTVESYSSDDMCYGIYANVRVSDERDIPLYLHEYRVLEPVETAEDDEPQPVDAVFAIGNVAQEVAKLKRKLSDLETTIERHELVNDRLKDEIDTLHKDNRTLGEELQKAQQDLRETMDDVSVMDEEIKRTGSDINEMSFAVEDLAEALKKTDPVYGERIFTAEEVVAVMTALKVRL